MGQCTATDAGRATAAVDGIESQVEAALDWLRPELLKLARVLLSGPLTPVVFLQFEWQLVRLLREFGRLFLERFLNGLEGDGSLLPHDVIYEGQGYRRLGKKTRNAYVATLFGTICLWRFAYRFWDPLIKESCIFPLELQLGLIEGATPSLAGWIGQRMAEAGATQSRVLGQLRDEHGVSLGVKRLRKLVSVLGQGIDEHRQAAQVDALLRALHDAGASRGNRRPVLAVGRDGITLCEYRYRFFEVATTATIAVFDRSGKRLTTQYLAFRPEPGQSTMSKMLTDLLTEVLLKWQGPLPTLAYVADSGGLESSYFEDALKGMRHPRTGQRLIWHRVVDFYHAANRVWTISEALFGKKSRRYQRWARRMLRVLKKKPRGAKRLLHSAAALASRIKMGKSRREEFRKAYNYIRKRTKWMRYSEYKKAHIPLGSGITEAACKTVYTQRLKLSGMRWKPAGAQQILTLRTVLLSRTWDNAYTRMLTARAHAIPTPYVNPGAKRLNRAA